MSKAITKLLGPSDARTRRATLDALSMTIKSNMAADKPEVLISQFVDTIGTRFQGLHLCFRDPAIQWNYSQYYYTTQEVRNLTLQP